MILRIALICCLVGCGQSQTGQNTATAARNISVDVQATITALLAEEDTDNDTRITIEDDGDRQFDLISRRGDRVLTVAGTYHLANLLQDLKLKEETDQDTAQLDMDRIWEAPVDRLSRTIRERLWDGLTRQIDLDHLAEVLPDEKVTPADGVWRLYVPVSANNGADYRYFSEGTSMIAAQADSGRGHRIEVVPLHEESLHSLASTRSLVEGLAGRHGLLSLTLMRAADGCVHGAPYVVPGGRFNEMYGWDSYFEVLGLLVDDRVDLARCMVDNHVFQLDHYGKILNANRTYYLTRSQPPFLTSMAGAVYQRLLRTQESRAWYRHVLEAAIREYREIWTSPPHITATGLSRYFGAGRGVPPEVEPGHFAAVFRPLALRHGITPAAVQILYEKGSLPAAQQSHLDSFFVHDRAGRESGHDTTYRWYLCGDRCADFVTVDLNSLLYKIELDIGSAIRDVFGDSLQLGSGRIETSDWWATQAAQRRQRMRQYLWDSQEGVFFDYNLTRQRRHRYFSATALYPLWACHAGKPETRILSPSEARLLLDNLLPRLEAPGGLAASALESRRSVPDSLPGRQWDWPNGWAPHQMLAWQGLVNYGFIDHATRLIYRWLHTIARNAADYNGLIPEKYNVVERSHAVFEEYGNVGTQFAYITREGFGWMNASFQVGLAWLARLRPDLRQPLNDLVPPEDIFE
jgi:alpha,alpha-trehalase